MCRSEAEVEDVLKYLLPLAKQLSHKLEYTLRLPHGELRSQGMIAAWEAATEYDGNKHESLWNYAYTTIKHRLVDQVRVEFGRTGRVAPKVHLPMDPQEPMFVWACGNDDERGYHLVDVEDQLHSILARLPEVHRYLLEATYLGEITLAEVGRSMGVTESRVCQLRTKALQAARQLAVSQLAQADGFQCGS